MKSLDISANQYRLYQIVLGGYLAIHFGYLVGYAAELFSSAGMLAQPSLSPLFGVLPTLFSLHDGAAYATALAVSGCVASVLFAAGKGSRASAAWMLLLLISFFVRNPLIANPALPYVGFMLLLHLFVPPLPRRDAALADSPWRLPVHLFAAASVVLAVSYSYSGYTKLLSPGWVAGETLELVLQNPLARDWWLRELFLALPAALLKGITWFILVVELLYAPLALWRPARFWLWLCMLVVQLGFLVLLSFPDLTFAMLVFHLLTFDPRWIAPKRLTGNSVIHYDGDCGLCHNAVRFALREAAADDLRFRAMQSDGVLDAQAMQSWRLTEDGLELEKTTALIRLLSACGGLWRVLAVVLAWVPKSLRDRGYDLIAANRRRMGFAAPEGLCPLMSEELRQRFS